MTQEMYALVFAIFIVIGIGNVMYWIYLCGKALFKPKNKRTKTDDMFYTKSGELKLLDEMTEEELDEIWKKYSF